MSTIPTVGQMLTVIGVALALAVVVTTLLGVLVNRRAHRPATPTPLRVPAHRGPTHRVTTHRVTTNRVPANHVPGRRVPAQRTTGEHPHLPVRAA